MIEEVFVIIDNNHCFKFDHKLAAYPSLNYAEISKDTLEKNTVDSMI